MYYSLSFFFSFHNRKEAKELPLTSFLLYSLQAPPAQPSSKLS